MSNASAVSRLIANNNFPTWSFNSRQVADYVVVTVEDDIAKSEELDRLVETLEAHGYATHLNGSRHLLVLG